MYLVETIGFQGGNNINVFFQMIVDILVWFSFLKILDFITKDFPIRFERWVPRQCNGIRSGVDDSDVPWWPTRF